VTPSAHGDQPVRTIQISTSRQSGAGDHRVERRHMSLESVTADIRPDGSDYAFTLKTKVCMASEPIPFEAVTVMS
jgi:hypothetical protein